MQPITIIQDPTCSAQATHIEKLSKTQNCISIGTICTGACLAQRKKLASTTFHEVVPQAAATVSFSCGTPPTKMGLHAILFKINNSIEDSI